MVTYAGNTANAGTAQTTRIIGGDRKKRTKKTDIDNMSDNAWE